MPAACRAHPRSRGEHTAARGSVAVTSGSSPLARGTPFGFGFGAPPGGLIPARAGNTVTYCWTRALYRAHPRSRGEHPSSSSSLRAQKGSSPLARGTLPFCRETSNTTGLIPARAGNTVFQKSLPHAFRAHPRSRGEHSRRRQGILGRRGSSPLARGTQTSRRRGSGRRGLIPARAGNTWLQSEYAGSGRAHPRSRGEHFS